MSANGTQLITSKNTVLLITNPFEAIYASYTTAVQAKLFRNYGSQFSYMSKGSTIFIIWYLSVKLIPNIMIIYLLLSRKMHDLVPMNFITYSFTGFIYPNGNDWDKFIYQTIQTWEDFYIEWIRDEKNIFVIYPDSFVHDLAKATLMDLAKFMGFEWNEKRLNCGLNTIGRTYTRRKSDPKKVHLDMETKKFIASFTKYCVPNPIYTLDIYSRKHLIWINSSIRAVKHYLEKRGLDSTYISAYKKKYFRIYLCPAA